jgi:hypothetical protein
VKTQRALLTIAAATLAATLGADAPGAEESAAVLSLQALQEQGRAAWTPKERPLATADS